MSKTENVLLVPYESLRNLQEVHREVLELTAEKLRIRHIVKIDRIYWEWFEERLLVGEATQLSDARTNEIELRRVLKSYATRTVFTPANDLPRIRNSHKIQVELDKRTFVPAKLRFRCPRCNTVNTTDFTNDYLSYPLTNEEIKVNLFCMNCDDQVACAIVILHITLDLLSLEALKR